MNSKKGYAIIVYKGIIDSIQKYAKENYYGRNLYGRSEMELNINSPAYFSEHYGVDDDVYRFCREVAKFFATKEYSDTLRTIGIIPIVAPKELYEAGAWKESVQLISNKNCAIVSIRMDFIKYYNGSSSEKILLTKEMILESVKRVRRRYKFDYAAFERDFKSNF